LKKSLILISVLLLLLSPVACDSPDSSSGKSIKNLPPYDSTLFTDDKLTGVTYNMPILLDWTLSSVMFVPAAVAPDGVSNIIIMADDIDPGADEEVFVEVLINSLRAVRNYNIDSKSERNIGGVQGSVHKMSTVSFGVTLEQTLYIAIYNDVVHVITYTYSSPENDPFAQLTKVSNALDVEKMVDAFRFR